MGTQLDSPLSLFQARLHPALQRGVEQLAQAQVQRPRWSAEQLLAHRLGIDPVSLYLEPPEMTQGQADSFLRDVAARSAGTPLQYLLGQAQFYGRTFQVGPGVFIPRPETEVLVEAAQGFWSKQKELQLLDVGTGSGTLAVTLALELPETVWSACDVSKSALEFAQANAAALGAQVNFLESDLTENLKGIQFDGIVSNLPYLDPEQSGDWPRELAWEPELALSGGQQGRALLARLVERAGLNLKPGGRLLLELADDQADWACEKGQEAGFIPESVIKDLAGLKRVVVLRWRGHAATDH